MIVREATAGDWPAAAEFFLSTPLESGTVFVLDRRPDFGALPGLRGVFRTFLAFEGERLAGTVTALCERPRSVTRSSSSERSSTFVWRHGRAADERRFSCCERRTRRSVRTAWTGLAASSATRIERRCHSSPVEPAFPSWWRSQGSRACTSLPGEFPLCLNQTVSLCARQPLRMRRRSLSSRRTRSPTSCSRRPSRSSGRTRLACTEPGSQARRMARRAACCLSGTAKQCAAFEFFAIGRPTCRFDASRASGAWLGIASPLPSPGGVLGLWASRVVTIRHGGSVTLRALLRAALRDATVAGRSVVQVNLHARDPLLRELPNYPSSIYRSTLYGCPYRGDSVVRSSQGGALLC